MTAVEDGTHRQGLVDLLASVIEHNRDVIESADQIIDLGSEGQRRRSDRGRRRVGYLQRQLAAEGTAGGTGIGVRQN